MAEALKNHFGPEIPERIGERILKVHREFDQEAFLLSALEGYEGMELTERARHISSALAETLPEERERAIQILVQSLGPETEEPELTGMDSFFYLPHVFFVAEYGLDCFETSMEAQYELTKRFTSEFSVRAFLDRFPEQTLERLREWSKDRNPHVRRLVSEGTRPRLPWAPRLRRFQEDPAPVLALLELLKDDPEEYVRRSVANNLNDISKDHPAVVVETARRWMEGASENRKRLIRHALRTLIKGGDPGALAILGYGADSPAEISAVSCSPERVEIGGRVQIDVHVINSSHEETGALVDLRVHFVKANGSTSPKVFKGSERILGPGEEARIRKTISIAQQSTRTHYPGLHRVEVLLNGHLFDGTTFEVL